MGSAALATLITSYVGTRGQPLESGYVVGFGVRAARTLLSAFVAIWIPNLPGGARTSASRFAVEIASLNVPPMTSDGGDSPRAQLSSAGPRRGIEPIDVPGLSSQPGSCSLDLGPGAHSSG